jgi:hypothetical protein
MTSHNFPLAQWADKKAGRWMLVYSLLIGLFLLASSVAPMEDHGSEFSQADEIEQAQRTADQAAATERDLSMQCGGENAVAVQVPKGVQCYDKRGRKTKLILG